MILTDKAEIDFRDWLFENGKNNDYPDFHAYSETCKNSLIIEWLDSVSIYIQSWNATEMGSEIVQYDCDIKHGNDFKSIDGFYLTRQQAITEAIKIANEIYNKKHD